MTRRAATKTQVFYLVANEKGEMLLPGGLGWTRQVLIAAWWGDRDKALAACPAGAQVRELGS